MYIPTEIIIIFFLISFLIYTMPMVLVKFSKTLKGKFLLLVLTIVMTLYNRTAGLLIAMLIIFLEEFNYEVNNGILYEGFGDNESAADESSADESTASEKPDSDRLTTSEKIKPKPSSVIPVSQTN
jgi:hypothetical protein